MGAAIVFARSPRFVNVSNTLKSGPGAFASFGPKCLATEMKFDLDHMTLRGTGPLLWLAGEFAGKTGSPPIQVHVRDSVFSVVKSTSGLVVLDAEEASSGRRKVYSNVGTRIGRRARERHS